jgi:acyl-CoA synthetase (AMP-forming)/AMP-acid ligase II
MTGGAGDLSHVGDRRLSPLPFAHVGAMTRLWDELMHVITTIIVPSPWTAEGALAAINDERVTVSQGVPTQYRMMFDHPRFAETDVSHLRVAGIGAARIPPELVIEMREKLGCNVLARYTSTEACVSTGTSINDDIDTICNTVGKPSAAVELRLVHEDGHACEQSEVGVVQLRSRAMMRGYWKDEERTREAFSSDGFLITGDLGFVDPKGDLHLVGRNTEMFIRGGYNVYPVEIENLLGAHPDVAAAAVVGASVDDRLGEIGVLFAVPRPGTTLTLESVRDHVRASLASYKAPDVLVCVTELPLTSLGKVDKKQLQPLADKEAAAWQR